MTNHPQLTVRYTIEELTVLADLYELDALPGCRAEPLTTTTRGLATRCLIARNVVAMPPSGGVEIQQPHATLFGTLFDADEVVQFIRHRPAQSTVEQWFVTDETTVRVFELEGIVTMEMYAGRVTPTVGSEIDQLPAASPITGFDEIVRLVRSGTVATVDRRLTTPAAG